MSTVTRCKDCGEVLNEPGPCPSCGSNARQHEVTLEAAVEVDTAQPLVVRILRGVTPERLALLLALLTLGLSVGIPVGISGGVPRGLISGFGAVFLLALIVWVVVRGGRTTHWVMELMRRIGGQ